MDDAGSPDHVGSGDPACWSHLLEDELSSEPSGLVVDLGTLGPDRDGGLRRIPTGSDLEAGLLHLAAGQGTGERVDCQSDVLLLVRSGSGELTIDGFRYGLRAEVLAVIPRGCRHAIAAGVPGLTYLAVRPLPSARPSALRVVTGERRVPS